MPGSLRVVALISGGKDSFFSLLHCLQNGHRIVALANLYPPVQASQGTHHASTEVDQSRHDDEDMNSFMYQTVGHQTIPLYAEALGIPLYRRQITGAALQTGRYYDTSELARATGDETENLTALLQEVLQSRPEVNAVSSGAILSTYQRTRVESVATRLRLTTLTYLWQYPSLPPSTERPDSLTGLLDDMAAAGCDARVIKIATGGMKEDLLWANVADTRTRSRLVSGMAPFFPDNEFWLRAAVLGEGGEYETLATDGPRPLWKKRLAINERDIVTSMGDGGVHYARIGEAFLEDKQDDNPTETRRAPVRTPKLYDPQFEAVLKQISTPPRTESDRLQAILIDLPPKQRPYCRIQVLRRSSLLILFSATSWPLTLEVMLLPR